MGYNDLEHDDHRVRLQAIHRASRDLGDKPERLLEVLTPNLSDPHAQVRAALAIALGDGAAGDPQFLHTLAKLAKTEDETPEATRQRLIALAALGRAGRCLPSEELRGDAWEKGCEAALLACASKQADTRFQALQALARLHATGERVVDMARSCLGDKDSETVAAAAELLAMVGDTDVLSDLDAARARLRDEPQRQVLLAMAAMFTASEVLSSEHAQIHADIVQALLSEARSLPYGLRACEVLGILGAAGDRTAVLETLTRIQEGWLTHRLIKVAAAAAMARLGSDAGFGALRKLMTHRKTDARGYAIEWMGRLARPEALSELRPILQNPKDYHSDTAAYALGLMDSPEADALLTATLEDPRSEVRLEAARALFRHGRAGEQLAQLAASDPDLEVRDAAAGLDDQAFLGA